MTQQAQLDPVKNFPPSATNGGNDCTLSAMLFVDGSGKLGLLGGFGCVALAEHLVAPGVRAWRITTSLKPVPQCASALVQCASTAPFAMPRVTPVNPPPAEGVIAADVYLIDATGAPIDPATVIPAGITGPSGFVFFRIEPAGSVFLIAP